MQKLHLLVRDLVRGREVVGGLMLRKYRAHRPKEKLRWANASVKSQKSIKLRQVRPKRRKRGLAGKKQSTKRKLRLPNLASRQLPSSHHCLALGRC